MISDIDRIPAGWLAALGLVQYVAPHGLAVLAGGALRDLLLGRPRKDLDVFISATTEQLEALIPAIWRGLDDSCSSVSFLRNNDEYRMSAAEDVTGFITVESFRLDLPLQIIGLSKPATIENVIDRIDFGLCRIAFDGERLEVTPEFKLDAANKRMTMLREGDEKSWERSQRRYERLLEKYPGFELVDGRPTIDSDEAT